MFLPNPGILAAGAGGGPVGQQLFTASGTFIVPDGVTSICAVLITRGGSSYFDDSTFEVFSGGGGGLAWSNDIPVSPSEPLLVGIFQGSGLACYLSRQSTLPILRAINANSFVPGYGTNGDALRSGGAGASSSLGTGLGGGGAAGYTSDGQSASLGGASNGGGGTSPLGGGAGALAGIAPGRVGAAYGGGAAIEYDGTTYAGGPACVRIMWGEGRAFPNTNTGDL